MSNNTGNDAYSLSYFIWQYLQGKTEMLTARGNKLKGWFERKMTEVALFSSLPVTKVHRLDVSPLKNVIGYFYLFTQSGLGVLY